MRRTFALAAALPLLVFIVAGCVGAPARSAAEWPPPGTPLPAWTAPQRETAFRNFDKVLPGSTVARGGQVRPLPASAATIDPRATFDGVEYTTARFMEANRVSGLIAVKDGAIVLERYGLGRGPEDPWVSFSVTKSITSTLVGAAIRDGHIRSLDDRVTRYIPELKGSAYDTVTIRDLLTMRSGVAWNEDYEDADADVYKVGMLPPFGALNPAVRFMRDLKRAAPAGSTWHYNTGETDLVGILVSSATGTPLHRYLSEKIWAPFGMERDAPWPADRGGHERGGCCLNMTLRDYARFGLFMLGGGKAGGAQVVPDGWVAEATRRHNESPGYGYFWWARADGYVARGIYGQAIYVFPAEQLVIAVNSAWPSAMDDDLNARQETFVAAIRRALPRAASPASTSVRPDHPPAPKVCALLEPGACRYAAT